MIPEAFIIEWRKFAPWKTDAQVEQDLILSRVLVALFENKQIAENLLFRGGTALHKLFLEPAARYSEDIDLVQEFGVPIGTIMSAIKKVCDPLLGKPKTKQTKERVVFYYRQESEIPPVVPMRIKIEINSREHFSVFGKVQKHYQVQSGWFTGTAALNTYTIEELLSTKLRALYQRKKGRDIFDLYFAILKAKPDPNKIIFSFKKYLEFQGVKISQKEFRNNLELKIHDPEFTADFSVFLRPNINYSVEEAFRLVDKELIDRI